jgi:signal transduction histidine kinase
MDQQAASRRENRIFLAASYIFLVAAALVGLPNSSSAPSRWAEAILLVVMGILLAITPKETSPKWQIHLYLGAQGSLTAVLLFLNPGFTMYPTLYSLLSFQAILLLTARPGAPWIAAYTLVTAVAFFIDFGLEEALYAGVVYAGINTFFGAFAGALHRVDAARRESEVLLQELREAHQQLQEYALRVEDLTVVEERNRLAREMHDTIGHRLTVASVQLEGAQRLCSADPERAASMVGTVRGQVREALSELRSTVATLRTPVEADLQLRSSLIRLMTYFEQATGLTIHRVLPDQMPDLPDAHRLAIYRATQEALTNVQKHARAGQVWLVLAVHDNAVTLLVSDDGKGQSFEGNRSGFGLRGLQERAEHLGGELHLEPRRGGGTQLTFRLPLSPREEVGEQGTLHPAEPEPRPGLRSETAGQQSARGANDV